MNVDEKKVIDYLNAKAKLKFRASSKELAGRLKEGYTVDECCAVVDLKVFQWLGTDMHKYLNPVTLFRPTNFPRYIAESQILQNNLNEPGKEAKGGYNAYR